MLKTTSHHYEQLPPLVHNKDSETKSPIPMPMKDWLQKQYNRQLEKQLEKQQKSIQYTYRTRSISFELAKQNTSLPNDILRINHIKQALNRL